MRRRLTDLADPAKAGPMAAYMKTDMPFYGVQKAGREIIAREVRDRFPVTDRRAYLDAIDALWSQPHREEKYLAIRLARDHERFITLASVPTYRRMIREGAWWDLVDDVAINLVGRVLLDQRDGMRPRIERWIDDRDLWIRRAALISQIKHKTRTDEAQLFDHCLRRTDEKDFFIRKAIGWALREYAHTAPGRVTQFLLAHRDELSTLSVREASRHLDGT